MVEVIDKTAPSLTVNRVDDNDKVVSGKTQAYASVVLGSKKADKSGNYHFCLEWSESVDGYHIPSRFFDLQCPFGHFV